MEEGALRCSLNLSPNVLAESHVVIIAFQLLPPVPINNSTFLFQGFFLWGTQAYSAVFSFL